jgi:outer membrane lipoprotein carrier protein
MKKIILATSIIFCALVALAQVDIKAKAALDAVSANLKALKSMKANFSLNISKTKEKKTGTIQVKGNKYVINTGAQEIYCDGKTTYTYQKASNEVTVNDVDPNEGMMNPSKLLTNFYDKEFKSKFIAEKKVGASTVNIIELTPLKVKQFTKVEVQVDRTKNLITTGKVFEKNGNIISYAISGFTPNAVITDNSFMWDAKKHPGVEVVDLR